LCAGNNLKIQFDRHTIGFHSEMFYERGNGEVFRKITLIAIDLEFHGFTSATQNEPLP
jgi:hypothetical protein